MHTCEQKHKKWHVAIAQKLDLIEQNQCDFWIQHIRFILKQLKKLRQVCCWPVLFKQVLLKTMEHCLLFLILFFQDSLLFFSCWDLDGKGIVPYLLHKHFQPYFWSSSGAGEFWVDCWVFTVLIICSVLFYSCQLEFFQHFVLKPFSTHQQKKQQKTL